MERKQTVADLIGRGGHYGNDAGAQLSGGVGDIVMGRVSKDPEPERLTEFIFIFDPSECEILDGKVVVRKTVIGRSVEQAMYKLGVQVR